MRPQGDPAFPDATLGLPGPGLPTLGEPLHRDSDIPSPKEAGAVPPVGDRGLSELGTEAPLPLGGGGGGRRAGDTVQWSEAMSFTVRVSLYAVKPEQIS